jgi:hypothetical protein
MDNYLIQLNLERDYDEMVKLLLNKERISLIKEYFTDINIKVLLSSFLIKNFYEYFLLTDNDELTKLSKKLCNFVMTKNREGVNNIYNDFHASFVHWRDHDIRGMKHEIEGAKNQLESMLTEEEPADDAEVQWNQGVNINIKIMDNTIKLLDIYGKTPPKL